MKCGIKEALGGLKVVNNITNTAAEPLSLNELLIPEKLKTVDPAVLQSSLRVAKDMFSVLEKLLGESSNMDLSKLRQIRCYELIMPSIDKSKLEKFRNGELKFVQIFNIGPKQIASLFCTGYKYFSEGKFARSTKDL